MRPVSNDKRKNIIEAKERGETTNDIIKWLDVSKSTINNIYKKYRDTGDYEPIAYTGRKPTFTEEINNEIIKAVTNKPDITLEELIDKLDLEVGISGLSRHMKKINLTLKKRHLIQSDRKSLK